MNKEEKETFDRCEQLLKFVRPRADMIGVRVGMRRHSVGRWYVFAKRQGMPQWPIRTPTDIERMAEAIVLFEEKNQS